MITPFDMKPNTANYVPPINSALFVQVSPAYVHTPKVAQPANAISTATFYLKWYLVYPAERTFSTQEVQNGHIQRTWMMADPKTLDKTA